MVKILLVDDDSRFLEVYSEIIRQEGYEVETADGGVKALEMLKSNFFQIAIIDVLMPDMNGMNLLQEICDNYPMTISMMLTGEGSVSDAVKAMEIGAFTYMLKPVEPQELIYNIQRAEKTSILNAENISFKSKQGETGELLGSSDYIKNLDKEIKIVAKSNASVLITGESGTGKEIIARKLHSESDRAQGPFVTVNCSALSENIFESELFGHEKGAFTGATYKKIGRIELANGGTLFFDEIGEIPMSLQRKLLRVLQEKNFERVGGTESIFSDFRFISATNMDLHEEVEKGNFREDLLFRIEIVPIHTEPVREHSEDIIELVDYYFNYFCTELKKPKSAIEEDAQVFLKNYRWRGNVREIRNFAERLAVFSDGTPITGELVRSFLSIKDNEALPSYEGNYREAKRAFQRSYITHQLDRNDWNITKTAKAIGLSRKTLYDLMAELEIEK